MSALCPLDGCYWPKVKDLAPFMSGFGLIKYRVIVEVHISGLQLYLVVFILLVIPVSIFYCSTPNYTGCSKKVNELYLGSCIAFIRSCILHVT